MGDKFSRLGVLASDHVFVIFIVKASVEIFLESILCSQQAFVSKQIIHEQSINMR